MVAGISKDQPTWRKKKRETYTHTVQRTQHAEVVCSARAKERAACVRELGLCSVPYCSMAPVNLSLNYNIVCVASAFHDVNI